MRVLVALGLIFVAQFLYWFIDPRHVGYAPLFWLLVVSLSFKLLRLLHEWYHYVSVSEPQPPVAAARPLTVDVLTTACPGEPPAMIVRTLEAMQAIRYPHTSYLCDEGNDPYLRQVCESLGVVHVTRTLKVDAKAGNINNALRQARGECCVVLDPDHVPAPDFLDHVMPYFADPQVGFVQVVQAYGNQAESWVARGAAEQTYHFYGPLMMGMNRYGTAQAIGANCTFRRAALDSIGGHAAGLTEDMHTAMRLHAAGWESIYVPRVLSRGLVPASLGAYYAQQLKWARGAFDLLFHVYPRLFSRFTWRQQLHYLTLPLYFLGGLMVLIDLVVPLIGLGISKFPWYVSLPEFAVHMGPVLAMSLLIRVRAQRWLREPHEVGLHLAGGLLRVGTWWVYLLGLVYTFLGVRVPYIPTPKEGERRNEWRLCLPNAAVLAVSLGLAGYGLFYVHDAYGWLLAALALTNATIMLVVILMGQQALLHRLGQRATNFPAGRALRQQLSLVRTWTYAQLMPQLQRTALPLALLLVLGYGLGQRKLQQWIAREQTWQTEKWLWTGDQLVRTGFTLPEFPALRALPASGQPATAADASQPGIVQVMLPPGAISPAVRQTLVGLPPRELTALITWPISPAELREPGWWRRIRPLARLPHPIMLRPQVLGSSSAREHRRAWRQLKAGLRRAGLGKTVLVWTSPQPDSVAQYFPGTDFVDWLAVEATRPGTVQADYHSFRRQVAAQPQFHLIPVMLFSPEAPRPARSRQLGRRFPELKAVVFGPPAAMRQPVLAQQ